MRKRAASISAAAAIARRAHRTSSKAIISITAGLMISVGGVAITAGPAAATVPDEFVNASAEIPGIQPRCNLGMTQRGETFAIWNEGCPITYRRTVICRRQTAPGVFSDVGSFTLVAPTNSSDSGSCGPDLFGAWA